MEASTQSRSTFEDVDSATPQNEIATISTPNTNVDFSYNTIWEQVNDISKQALDTDQDDAVVERISSILNELNQITFQLLKTQSTIWARSQDMKENYKTRGI